MKFGQADFGVERAACFGGGVWKFAGDIYFPDFENQIIESPANFNLIVVDWQVFGVVLVGLW